MSANTVLVRLPEGVAREVERLAREAGTTPEQFLASAAAEKVDAIASAADFFAKRGERADWAAFERVFAGGREAPQAGDEVD